MESKRERKWFVIEGDKVSYICKNRGDAIEMAEKLATESRLGEPFYVTTSDGIIEEGRFKPAVDPDYEVEERVRANIDEDGRPF